MSRFILFFFLVSVSFYSSAQDSLRVLTLEECINSALNKNLTIKRSANSLIAAQSNKRQSRYNYLPTVNAQIDYSIIEGSNFDSNVGQFVNTKTETSTPGIRAGFNLFNAFANHHLLNRRTHEYRSAEYQLQDSKIAIRAQVTRNYLNVLLDTENLKISDQRLELLENQLEREKKRESVGVGNLETVYNFQSQVATERLNNVNLQNLYRSDLLSLIQSAQITGIDQTDVKIKSLSFQEDGSLLDFDDFQDVLNDILANSFGLKSADEFRRASESSFKQVKSDRYPTIFGSAGIGALYSTNGTGDYTTQLRNTQSTFYGATLTIPIFNRFFTQNSIDNAKVAVLNSQIDYEQALLDITNSAQSDYLDLRAAQTQYVTAIDNFEALNQTFEFSKKRFEAGNSDFYTYLQALNNKNQAESQLVNAKYTILLRKQILDMYRQPITH